MRHRGSLPTTSALIIFAFYLHTSANTHHRLKRQTLPSDHIQVHSFNSNVSIRSSTVSVVSDESRIDLTERFLSGQVWSQNSLLEFEPRGHSENIYATDTVRTLFSVLGANLSTKADRLELLLSSNRTEDGHSHLEMVAESDIDLVLLVRETHVEAANARMAHISMHTWQLSLEPRLTLTSNISTAMNRQLFITSTTNNYNLIITLDGAKVNVLYGKVSVKLADDYRSLQLISASHTVQLQTVLSPFDIFISAHEMWIRCTDDNIAIHTNFNSTNVYVDVEQFAKALIERREDELKIGGDTLESSERIQLTSMQLAMVLESGEISGVHAFANKSQIVMQTNATKMTSTASHHTVNITGGTATLQIFTGNVSITITTNIGEIVLPTSLSLLTPPTDNFATVGPPSIDIEPHGSPGTDVEKIDDILTHTTPPVSIRTGSTTSSSIETTRTVADATELSTGWILPNEQPISSVRTTANGQIDTAGNTKGHIGTAHETDNVYGTSNEIPFPEGNIIPGGTENSIGLTTTFIVPSNETAVFSETTNGVSDQKMVYSTQENVFTQINTVDTSDESGNRESGAEQAGNQPTLNAVFTSSAVVPDEQLPSQVPVIGEEAGPTSEVNSTSVSQNFENLDDTSLTNVKELPTNPEGVLLRPEMTHEPSTTSQTGTDGNEQQQTAVKSDGRQPSSMNEHRDIQEGEAVLTNPRNISEESNSDEHYVISSLEVVTTAANEATRDNMMPSALEPLKVAEPCMTSSALTLNSGEKESYSDKTTQRSDLASDSLETTTDVFIIAQFGNSDWSGNDSLEIFATITNIVVDPTLLPSDITTLPETSHSSVRPDPNSFQHNSTLENDDRNDEITWQHRRRSMDRNVRTEASERFGDDSTVRDSLSVDGDGILELQLRVPRSVDSDGTEFRSGISFALNGIIEEMLEKRGKRSALIGNESPVKITGTEREDDEVSVHFVVDDSAKVGNLSDSLNEIVFSGASASSIPYPIVGNIKYLTKRSSNTTLFISASLAVLLLLSMIAFCWKVFQEFGYIERISMYLRRSRVVDLSMSDKHNSITVCA